MAKMLLYLLNYVNSNSSADACEYDCDTFYDEIVVRVEEVTNAIKKLDVNKASGSDGICSERLKCADKALVPVLSMCFTSFLLVDICHSQCCQLYLCDCDTPVGLRNWRAARSRAGSVHGRVCLFVLAVIKVFKPN